MQPYLFPYLGYFQLLAATDAFVVYDNIQYTKRGWINRNQLLENGQAAKFTVPLASASDYLDIREREIAGDYSPEKLIGRFTRAYRDAPYLEPTLPLLQDVLANPERNLFGFLHHALLRTAAHLELDADIRVSSTIPADHSLRGQERVVALCRELGATTYVNPIGGVELYSAQEFAAHGIELQFLRMLPLEYPQVSSPFVPSLSIIDVLVHNPLADVQRWLATHYELTTGPAQAGVSSTS